MRNPTSYRTHIDIVESVVVMLDTREKIRFVCCHILFYSMPINLNQQVEKNVIHNNINLNVILICIRIIDFLCG